MPLNTDAYVNGIRKAYEGELAGEGVYRRFADATVDADRREKLNAIADVERATHQRLKPIAERFAIKVDIEALEVTVERRVAELTVQSWDQFIAKAMRDWPPFVERFESLKSIAPDGDEALMQSLVDHEVALVEFVRREQHGSALVDCLSPLHAYLRRSQNQIPAIVSVAPPSTIKA